MSIKENRDNKARMETENEIETGYTGMGENPLACIEVNDNMGDPIPILTRRIEGYYDECGHLVIFTDTLIDRRKEAEKRIEEIRNRGN